MQTISELNDAPRFIRVGSNTFQVLASHRDSLNRSGLIGEVNFDTFEINVQVGAPQKMADTLLHEVMHAIHLMFKLDDESTEEEFTESSSSGLLMVMADNPYFVEWLLKNTGIVDQEQMNDE